MSLVRIQKKGTVTLPSRVRSRLGLAAGDLVDVRVRASNIVIIPRVAAGPAKLPNADDEYTPAQRRYIDARLDKADKDIKAGRTYGPFETHEALIDFLHSQRRAVRKKTPSSKPRS